MLPYLLIYLKKPDDLKQDARKLPSNLSKMKIGGYSPVKEFYSPDYSTPEPKHSNADLRTTLLWQPYIITDKETNEHKFRSNRLSSWSDKFLATNCVKLMFLNRISLHYLDELIKLHFIWSFWQFNRLISHENIHINHNWISS